MSDIQLMVTFMKYLLEVCLYFIQEGAPVNKADKGPSPVSVTAPCFPNDQLSSDGTEDKNITNQK